MTDTGLFAAAAKLALVFPDDRVFPDEMEYTDEDTGEVITLRFVAIIRERDGCYALQHVTPAFIEQVAEESVVSVIEAALEDALAKVMK